MACNQEHQNEEIQKEMDKIVDRALELAQRGRIMGHDAHYIIYGTYPDDELVGFELHGFVIRLKGLPIEIVKDPNLRGK